MAQSHGMNAPPLCPQGHSLDTHGVIESRNRETSSSPAVGSLPIATATAKPISDETRLCNPPPTRRFITRVGQRNRPRRTTRRQSAGSRPAPASSHYTGLPKAWLRILALSDSDNPDKEDRLGNLTLHGLRHAFASVANELGYTEATRAALLGHASTHSQTGDYTHHLDSVLIAAADRVSSKIRAMINGHEAEVIDLPPPTGHVGTR